MIRRPNFLIGKTERLNGRSRHFSRRIKFRNEVTGAGRLNTELT
jgi:hypothetical protein